jgi:translation initiation factor IF-3
LQKNYQIKFKIQAFGRIGTKKEIIEEVYQKFLSLLEGVGTPLAPLKQTSHTGYEATIVKTK